MYIQLILWEKCNINCSYCHLGYKNYDTIINKNIIINLLEKLKEYSTIYPNKEILLEFQGGEPLSYFEEIRYIVKEYKKRFWDKIKFILTTNGVLINDNILSFLSQNKSSISLNISFDWNKDITTVNRTQNNKITDIIINNIQKVIKKWIKLTIIWTINKNWIDLTNNDPMEIVDYINENFNKHIKTEGQIKYFFRPEILLDSSENYGIKVETIISFHKALSKLLDNEYYSIKEYLIEFNKDLASDTLCIDYNWTLYPNDYYKSFIKRYNKHILKDYEKIFNIYNISDIENFNWMIIKLENKIKNQRKDINYNIFIDIMIKTFLININKVKVEISGLKEINKILKNLIESNLHEDYFIFTINKETYQIYKKI